MVCAHAYMMLTTYIYIVPIVYNYFMQAPYIALYLIELNFMQSSTAIRCTADCMQITIRIDLEYTAHSNCYRWDTIQYVTESGLRATDLCTYKIHQSVGSSC